MAFLALIVLLGTELFLLIEVGAVTSALFVVGWVILGIVLGLNLMRRGVGRVAQLTHGEAGVATVMTPLGPMLMRRPNQPTQRELFDVMGLVFAGFLFALPGLVSDVLGLALLVRPLRVGLMTKAMALRTPRQPKPARDFSKGPRAAPDVEVLPPGSLPRSPLRKRPVVIDVE